MSVFPFQPLPKPSPSPGGVEHWGEIPTGPIDGLNDTYTLAVAPNPSNSLMLYRDGLLMKPGTGNDFRLFGDTIIFEPGNAPEYDATMMANYTS